MKFQSKPQIIEAHRWFPWRDIPGVVIAGLRAGPNHPYKPRGKFCGAWVLWNGQKIELEPGNWIVKYPDGLAILNHDYLMQEYMPVCECGHVSCICLVRENHQPGCRFLRAARLGAELPCEHRLQACPICDPCTCGAGETRGVL